MQFLHCTRVTKCTLHCSKKKKNALSLGLCKRFMLFSLKVFILSSYKQKNAQ